MIKKGNLTSGKDKFRSASEFLISMLYPRRCPSCDEIIPQGRGLICPACVKAKKMTRIKEPYCMKCGKELEREGSSLCGDCKKASHLFERSRAVFRYTKEARQSIVRFKFHNKREYADYYAAVAAESMEDYLKLVNPEVILPVPMYKKKKIKRGYNQAEVFARRLSEKTGILYRTDVLVRIKNTVPLKELEKDARKEELEQAFFVRRERVGEWKRVLLVDDIYTTGATMDACSHALKAAGIKKVYGLTLAIGAGLLYTDKSRIK